MHFSFRLHIMLTIQLTNAKTATAAFLTAASVFLKPPVSGHLTSEPKCPLDLKLKCGHIRSIVFSDIPCNFLFPF